MAGPMWTDAERAALSAFLTSYQSEAEHNESVLEDTGGAGSSGSDELLSEGN